MCHFRFDLRYCYAIGTNEPMQYRINGGKIMKQFYKWAKCSECNYANKYTYRENYGYLQVCEICATSLNKEAK